jgi:hypothetical protein
MGSPIPAPSSKNAPSLPASDVAPSASAISTQEVDTQYLQDLLGMSHGVSTAPDSEMLGTLSIRRVALHQVTDSLQIWRRRSWKRLDHPAIQILLVRRSLVVTTVPRVPSG